MENTKSLIDIFEDSFSNCTLAFSKQMSSLDVDKGKKVKMPKKKFSLTSFLITDDIKLEVEQTTTKFTDLARQMENFFLQKRCYLSKTKPELLLKEENGDLRHEISRKDEHIKKHIQKLNKWKEMLSDSVSARLPGQVGPMQGENQGPGPMPPGGPPGPQRFPLIPPQMMQQQQQMMPQAPNMFVPNPNIPRPNFSPMPPAGGNNPLAFLESISKTTNNIDLPPR